MQQHANATCTKHAGALKHGSAKQARMCLGTCNMDHAICNHTLHACMQNAPTNENAHAHAP
eukprot:3459216-Alexandrium_andersonii.AAC.1